MLPDTSSGLASSRNGTCQDHGSGRSSQSRPAPSASTQMAAKAGNGSWVRGQISCANAGE